MNNSGHKVDAASKPQKSPQLTKAHRLLKKAMTHQPSTLGLPATWQWVTDKLQGQVGGVVSRSVAFVRQPVGLHAMITSAGVEHRIGPHYDWHGLRRGSARFVLLQYTLAGQGRLRFESQTKVLSPGQVMLLYFPHDHRYWLESGEQWSFFYLCLHGSEVVRAWQAAVTRLGPVLSLTAESPLIAQAAQLCRSTVEGGLDSPWEASTGAYRLAMQLMALALPGDSTQVHNTRPMAIQRAIDFCRSRLDHPMNVEDLAQAAGYSRYHFTRLFTKSEGLSPGMYILRERLAEAMRLVQTTREPVKVIAHRCGFADTAYFCRAFRRCYGASPGSLRMSGMYG
ncbi:MAG: AraC family transcriptional regulator [Phycisphaerales bacterium]|nr:AraC family transcriptional regulator [Phycisphaerales bacterium]